MSLDGATPVEEQRPAHRYRPTIRSIPWLLGFLILPLYEVLAIVYKWDGGALSHLFWWAYGDRGTLRWWLLSCGFTGWSAWCCAHFALRWPGLPQLLTLLVLGLLIGLAGYLTTR